MGVICGCVFCFLECLWRWWDRKHKTDVEVSDEEDEETKRSMTKTQKDRDSVTVV